MEDELTAATLDGRLTDFQEQIFPMIEVPPNRVDRPSIAFIERVNILRGWRL